MIEPTSLSIHDFTTNHNEELTHLLPRHLALSPPPHTSVVILLLLPSTP